jgi:hypothetical protein
MLAWLHTQLLSSSYHASRLTFGLVGLVAIYLTYRAGVMLIGDENPRLFYVIALTPSMLFWSSILGKDPVALLAVAACVYGAVGWYKVGRPGHLAWIALGILIGVYVRPWLGPILLMPLALLGGLPGARVARRLAFIGLGMVGILVSPIVIQNTLGIATLTEDEILERTNYLARSFDRGGSTQEVPDLGTIGGVAGFVPLGVFTVLFRPLPGEIPTVFGVLAGVENAFLLLLALRAIWRTRLSDLRNPLVLWALATVLLWAFVYAVGSYQNLGTAIRHRVEIMPVQLGLLLYLGRRRVPRTLVGAIPGRVQSQTSVVA